MKPNSNLDLVLEMEQEALMFQKYLGYVPERITTSLYPWGWAYKEAAMQSQFRDWCTKKLGQTKPPVRVVPMGLFPTMNSLQEVLSLAESKLPITNRNDLVSLLFTYHNTLLSLISK